MAVGDCTVGASGRVGWGGTDPALAIIESVTRSERGQALARKVGKLGQFRISCRDRMH